MNNRVVWYHLETSCNSCGGETFVDPISHDDGYLAEAKTLCRDCGFKDYWVHGFFQSSSEIKSNCLKYSFESGKKIIKSNEEISDAPEK